MGFISRATSKPKISNITVAEQEELYKLFGITPSAIGSDKLKEVVYFTCLKIRMDAMGKMPIKLYQGDQKLHDKVWELLSLRPNPYMTSADYFKLVEYQVLHKGNSVSVINWDNRTGEIISIVPLDPDNVEYLFDNVNLFSKSAKNKMYYRYRDGNKSYLLKSEDVLHFKGFTTNGFIGEPVLNYLIDAVEVGQAAQVFTKKHFQEGLMSRLVLQYTGDIKMENRRILQRQFSELNGGVNNAGKIIPMPLGFSLNTIDAKLTDSQFLDLKKLSAMQISAALGIKPHMLNDLEKSSYASIDALNEQFYKDTLLGTITDKEMELNYKLVSEDDRRAGKFWKFNVDVLLRPDQYRRAEIYAKGVQGGWMMPSEARSKEDLPFVSGSDRLYGNGNLLPLEMAGIQWLGSDEYNEEDVVPAKGGENE
jgi:HK97 family phage portal protein